MAKQEPYPSDLTDKEWSIIGQHLPEPSKLGRPPRYQPRVIVRAIFYVTRSGCSWRMLPREFPHWRLVYYYFSKWHKQGVWERINHALRDKARVKSGKKKPRRPRSSTVRASRWLASLEGAASMRERRSWDVSGTWS